MMKQFSGLLALLLAISCHFGEVFHIANSQHVRRHISRELVVEALSKWCLQVYHAIVVLQSFSSQMGQPSMAIGQLGGELLDLHASRVVGLL